MTSVSLVDPEATETPGESELLAVVDLGSNSFQLLIAGFSHGQLRVVDRLREMVRMAAGLDAQHNLDAPSQQRALDCLARFGERLRDIPPERVRAVGTNTLRKARDPSAWLAQAEALLGHEINIISGIEEARLIFMGVSHSLPAVSGRHLVIDIGGGSTEVAGGEGYQPGQLESLYMGCVGMSQRFFPQGKLTRKRFDKARTAVRLELRPVAPAFCRTHWERAAGASGTIRAVAAVLREQCLTDSNITPAALEQLIDLMIERGHVEQLELSGLSSQRAPVFAGGVAILIEILQQLGITELVTAQGALREGIMYDLAGRLGDEDSRTRTVRAMATRYHVELAQAARVEQTALLLLEQVAEDWKLNSAELRKLLVWAAQLHEIGLDIAHSHYHKHGAYLLEHADMPGFTRNEQQLLACLVHGHRRKLAVSRSEEKLPESAGKRVMRLIIVLRLAVLFNRSRSDESPGLLQLQAKGRELSLSLSEDWLRANPLTLADLNCEQDFLRQAGYELTVVSTT